MILAPTHRHADSSCDMDPYWFLPCAPPEQHLPVLVHLRVRDVQFERTRSGQASPFALAIIASAS